MISYFDFFEVSTCLLQRLAPSKSHFGPRRIYPYEHILVHVQRIIRGFLGLKFIASWVVRNYFH